MAKTRQFSADREQRTSATGLLRYAEEYREAAEIVKASKSQEVSVVSLMLIHHSIELSFKAYLRSRGATLGQLMDLGHDLGGLYDEAMRQRIDRLWPYATSSEPSIRLLADANKYEALRYIINGTTTIPAWMELKVTAEALVKVLYKHCLRRTFGREQGLAIARARGGKF